MKARIMFLFVAATAMMLVAQAEAVPISVGVIYGGTATGPELVSQLNDDTFFDFSAVGIGASAADTPGELSAYDVVVLGDAGNRSNGYTAAMYAALRTYMDGGGGVVTVGWYNYATDIYTGQQALDADYIAPFADGSYNHQSTPGTVDILSAAHPITSGISDYAFSGNNVEYETGVDPGAVALGSVVGIPSAVTIAYQEVNGRSVYLGGLYLAQTSYNNSGLRSGVEDQLLEQGVAWAAGSSATAVPEPSTLLLLGTGLVGLVGYGRRKRRA